MTDGLPADSCEQLLAEATCVAAGLVPTGSTRVDAHCHLGEDSDGSSIEPGALERQLAQGAIDRAIIIPLHAHDGYDDANSEVLRWADEHDGRFLPLWRCDPHRRDARANALRGFAEGAHGIKLHPRAERFAMDAPGVRAVCEVAAECDGLVLVHCGRGIPALGEDVVALARDLPSATFVLAHAGISDLAWLAGVAADITNIAFDTAWWRPLDLIALMASIPPSRVLFGSDPPYGTVPLGVVLAARIGRALGYNDGQMSALFGGNVLRAVSTPNGDADEADAINDGWLPLVALPYEVPWSLRRCADYLCAAVTASFADGDVDESLELAQLALDVPPSDGASSVARSLAHQVAVVRAGARAGADARLVERCAIVLATIALTPNIPVAPGAL